MPFQHMSGQYHIGRTAANAVSIVGMAFVWKYFRSSTGVQLILQPYEGAVASSELWTVAAYLAMVASAFLVCASARVRRALVSRRGVLVSGLLATFCLWSPWCVGGFLPAAWSRLLLAASVAVYALAFAATMCAWAAFLSHLAGTSGARVPLFIVAISLLLDLVMSLLDIGSSTAFAFLNTLAPLVSSCALAMVIPQAKRAGRGAERPGTPFFAPTSLLVGVVCMLALAIMTKELVGPIISSQAFVGTPLIKNILTIMELALVISICLFTSDIGSFLRFGWLILAGLSLAELLAVALLPDGSSLVFLIALFTVPVCYEMYALQLVTARHLADEEGAARAACLLILIPEALAHAVGRCLTATWGAGAAALTDDAQALACVLGTLVVICLFCTVSSLAFRQPSGDAAPGQGDARASQADSVPADGVHDRIAEMARRHALTPRECDVIGYLCRGYTNKRIAELCCVSVNTVQTHIQNCYRKLDVHTRQELIDKLEQGTE